MPRWIIGNGDEAVGTAALSGVVSGRATATVDRRHVVT